MSEYVLENYAYKDYIVEIWQDPYHDDFNNPRSWCNVATMVCWHPDYVLGDVQLPTDSETISEYIEEKCKESVALPLYLIDHSGIAMNTGGFSYCDPDGWDSGQVGFIYITDEAAIEHGLQDSTDDELREMMKIEVSSYSSYLEGDVIGYTISYNGDIKESCGGFVGDYEHCKEEAEQVIDWLVSSAEKESEARKYWESRDIVTVTT